MTVIEQMIRKITYKPKWQFTFEASPPTLVTDMWVQDAWHPGEWCNFTVKRAIPDYLETPDLFLKWLKGILVDVEIHELREFLRYDGELVDNPHAQ